jgi:hypothetical protein
MAAGAVGVDTAVAEGVGLRLGDDCDGEGDGDGVADDFAQLATRDRHSRNVARGLSIPAAVYDNRCPARVTAGRGITTTSEDPRQR